MTTLYTPEYLHVLRTAYADGKAPARVELLHMLDHVDTLTARLAAVRELHTSVKPDSDGEHYLDPLTRKPKCGECLLIYPCPTIKAINGD